MAVAGWFVVIGILWVPVDCSIERIILPEPEVDGSSLSACHSDQSHLKVVCPPGSVVTANVYGSAEGCGYEDTQCLAQQQGTTSPALCLWKNSECLFPTGGLILMPPQGCVKGPTTHTVALDVKCVPGKLLSSICTSNMTSQSSGYIFNEGYPLVASENTQRCALNISTQKDGYVRIQVLDFEMATPLTDCEQYVQLRRFNQNGGQVGRTLKFKWTFTIYINEPTTEVAYVNTCGSQYGARFLLYYKVVSGDMPLDEPPMQTEDTSLSEDEASNTSFFGSNLPGTEAIASSSGRGDSVSLWMILVPTTLALLVVFTSLGLVIYLCYRWKDTPYSPVRAKDSSNTKAAHLLNNAQGNKKLLS